MIGRAQGVDVKFAGGVLHPCLIRRVDLKFSVVRRRRDDRAAFSHVLNYRDGQRCALRRVGTRAEFVKEYQRSVVAFGYYVNYVAHVCREGRQALLNALLVAYVGQYVREHGQSAAVVRRDMQAALVHRRKQTYRLYRDGLAAGVRACDNERIKAVSQLHVYRHGLALVEQWVPRVAQYYCPLVHRRLLAVELIGELGLGKYQVESDKHVIVRAYIVPVLCAVRGELGKDAVYLRLLLRGKLTQLVIRLDRAHRLDEKRRPGGGNVMHQPRHGALELCLHRHDIAVGAHRDYRLLQSLGVARGGNNLLQRFPRP